MAFDFPNAPTVGQTYQGYVWDGEKWVSISAPAAPNQSGVIGVQVFTASGQYTPSANMTTCVIECVGGGGGGGSAAGAASQVYTGGGGGSGSYSRKVASAMAVGVAQTVTVGAAGNGGAAGSNNGTAGSDTSVGTLCIGKGGAGGIFASVASVATGGSGGVAGTGDFAAAGTPGQGGFYNSSNATITVAVGGGGSSYFGGGATPPASNNIAGAAASKYGSGGGGASAGSATGFAGGNGSPGVVIVTEYGMTALSPATAQLGNVRYDLPQGLTANQTAQARANIWVTKKNYIINGAMMISQENGSTAGTAAFYYPVDMFWIQNGSSGVMSGAQVTSMTPGGSAFRLRATVTTADAAVAAGDYSLIGTKIEGYRFADLKFGYPAAKTITIQFGVKAPAGTYCIAVSNNANNRSYIAEYVITAADVTAGDVVKSVTIPGDVAGTWDGGNLIGLDIYFTLMAGTTFQQAAGSWGTLANAMGSANQSNFMGTAGNTFELFDVSLTEGSVAPPFQVPDYVSELALCKRYFYNGIPKLAGVAISAVSASRLGGNHPVIMRAAPTVTIITALPIQTASGGTATVTGIGTNYSTAGTLEFDGVSSSLPGGFVHTYQGAGGNISVNARL